MTMTSQAKPRLTSFAPQFLVDDLERSIAYYRRLGFSFGEPWGGFYAIGYLDGFELHLKEPPKNPAERRYRRENEHLDAAAGVDGAGGAQSGGLLGRPARRRLWQRLFLRPRRQRRILDFRQISAGPAVPELVVRLHFLFARGAIGLRPRSRAGSVEAV